VNQANDEAIRRFAKEGRDADGNLRFPADRAMAGERFAQTRMRLLQSSDVQNWTGDDLQYAINEIFARHGFVFPDPRLAALFAKLNWYRPRGDLNKQEIDESLSDIEVQNVVMLHSVTVARKEEAERLRQAALAQQQNAERLRQAALAQQKQQEAAHAQQEAVLQQQREAAVAGMVGGILQAIINHRK
jgi:hypothetical protein